MPDGVPVRCLECGHDQWHLHRTPRGGLSAACARCGATTVLREEHPDGLSRAEVAALFRVAPRTVTRWRAAGRLTPVPAGGGAERYRAADVRALLEEPGDVCPRGYPCARYPDLADVLGHDRQGHAILKALVAADITTRDRLAMAELRDVPGLGTTRIVLIRHRLGKAEAEESVRR
jgi:Helix-turn-helix domain